MNTEENLHAGHRERILNKFLKSPDSFSEHELLELLLFQFLPRIDTNLIAHRLLAVFGNIFTLFNSDAESIMAVKGIGKKTAENIVLLGKIFNKIKEPKKDTHQRFSFENNKTEIINIFKDEQDEKSVIFLLDSKYREIIHLCFEDKNRNSITADIPELITAFAIHKPSFAIIAHNHPSGNVFPSKEDDFATKKLNIVCALHGIELCDHIICSGNKLFSYSATNRINYIKETSDLNKIIQTIK